MEAWYSIFAALAVAGIYIAWQRYQLCARRERALQERVTYMLWTMASQMQ
jgi:hypothetical protein